MVNLKDLRYLVALADTGHFGKAAERCFVSQPTLSAQIKKLERYLGAKLLERQPNNLKLTEIGKQVVDRGRQMLKASEDIVALARDHGNPLSGRLQIAFLPTVGPYLLPRIMQKAKRAMPSLRLMLYEHQTAVLLDKLHRGELDLGVLALPVHDERLKSRALYEEEFRLAAPEGHALAKRARAKVSDLQGETVLLLEDGHCMRDQALEVCGRMDIREVDGFRATSLETLRQMVVAGLGVTLMPALAVEAPFGSQRGLTVRPFAAPAPTRTIGAVWRKTSTRVAAIDAVCDIIERCMRA